LSVVQPGGYPGIPVLTGIARVTNGVVVTWDSPAGYCQLHRKQNLTDPAWQAIGTPYNLSGVAAVSNLSSPTFFRVFSPPPQYAGAQVCTECHADVLNTVVHTAHFSTNIFTNSLWLAQGGGTNTDCLACHTVGYNLPTGFTNQSVTPHLAGVQCENCHGPAARHATNPGDPTAKPRVDIAATVCGGCHNNQFVPVQASAEHPPTYEEWSASPHQTFDVVCARCHDPHQQLISTNLVSGATCGECHTRVYEEWSATPHHTFDVVCQRCHDPHLAVVDTNLLSGTTCGDCHTPIYQQWSASLHATVTPEVQADFLGPRGPTVYIPNCGKCHSGTVRDAYLENEAMPDGPEACAVGVSCPTCHDPHEQHVYTNVISGSIYTNQVLNPLSSLQDYHTAGDWATNYNPDINICGQCHNDRGAAYTDTSRPPHHSPQYNMLLGTVGVAPTNFPAPHAYAEEQCVTCHMQAEAGHSPSQPGNAGHGFGRITNSAGCGGPACHGAGDPANLLVPVVAGIIQTNPGNLFPVHPISEVHSRLVEWALTKAPAILGTAAYGTNAWAYTSYSSGDPFVGGPGPSANLQPLIPTNIKIARFNLYIVQNDGSFGTHNFYYTVDLLNTAYDLVTAELLTNNPATVGFTK